METKKLLLDASRGIYIPKVFFDDFDFEDWGLDQADYTQLSSPENEGYWDAWDDLLRKAEHTDKDGTVWRLEQDGDLWLVNTESDGWEVISERELESRYDDFLDECYGVVKIGPYEYSTSNAMKNCDDVAYRTGFNDWLDSEISEGHIKEADGEYWIES